MLFGGAAAGAAKGAEPVRGWVVVVGHRGGGDVVRSVVEYRRWKRRLDGK